MTNEQLCHLARDGDSDAKDELIKRILPSIRIIAAEVRKRFAGILIEKEDLIQEALISTLRAIEAYDPESGNLFQTYAEKVAENAMLDYARKCVSAIPSTGTILSLDAPAPGFDPANAVTYGEIIFDDFSKTPEQIFIKKETIAEVRHALQMISDRERTYLHYRYGFIDDQQHDQIETASHFHLSTSRAKSIEHSALKNVEMELPWW